MEQLAASRTGLALTTTTTISNVFHRATPPGQVPPPRPPHQLPHLPPAQHLLIVRQTGDNVVVLVGVAPLAAVITGLVYMAMIIIGSAFHPQVVSLPEDRGNSVPMLTPNSE